MAGLVPAIRALLQMMKNLDAGGIGKRKRRRPLDGDARA